MTVGDEDLGLYRGLGSEINYLRVLRTKCEEPVGKIIR